MTPRPATGPVQLPLGPPVRIQRRRTAGWRMPDSAVYVGRPTRWGNPYPHTGTPASRAAVVAAYRDLLDRDPDLTAAARRLLAGRDLACWCPPEQPCHADVLLELANPTTPGGHSGE
jgi:hypothetical protein